MSVRLMSAVFRLEINPIEIQGDNPRRVEKSTLKLVLLAMADSANDDGEGTYNSRSTLQLKTGLAYSALAFAINALKQDSYISYNGISKRGTSNYSINLEKIGVLTEDGKVSSQRTAPVLTEDGKVSSQRTRSVLNPSNIHKDTGAGKNRALYPIAEALAKVCQMDLRANESQLFKEAKLLSNASPPPTPELIRAHYNGNPRAFWANDWRGKGGKPPTPAQVRQTWGQWKPTAPDRTTPEL